MTTIVMDKPLTVRQKALIDAIDAGVTALRDLADACDYSSISVVKYNLEVLANRGLVALDSFDNSDRPRAARS
jgi:hypothetical protein